MRKAILAIISGVVLLALGLYAALPAVAQSGDAVAAPSATASLNVLTIERQPFAMQVNGRLTGFSIELWQEVAKELKLEHQFSVETSFADMLKKIAASEADAAIANITITSEREQVLDFSQPMFDSGLQVMVRADGNSGGLIAAIFNWEMLGLLLLAGLILFVVGNLMWWFERREHAYFQYPYGEGMWRAFWWALNLMVNGGFEERVPQTRNGRIFATFLVIASLFLVSAFVAKITASLTVGELKSQIESYRDLFNRRVGTTAGSTSAAFLDQHSVPYRSFGDMASLVAAMDNEELDAVVHDAPVLAYYVNTKAKGRMRLVGSVLKPENYGIALPSGSIHREGINRALLRIREDGRYADLSRKWFGARQ